MNILSRPTVAVGAASALLFLAATVTAQSPAGPAPPGNVEAADHPNDVGEALDVTWEPSPDDQPGLEPRRVALYEIRRREASQESFEKVGDKPYGRTMFTDEKCERGKEYFYEVLAVAPDGSRSAPVATVQAAVPVRQWLNLAKIWFGIILVFVCGAVVYFIRVAESGRKLKVRPIAGLEAVDEAVGRATEMGRPILFIAGIQDINDIQTIAGITVLARVARTAAEYDAEIEMPTSRALVMTIARETVESAYLAAGRPDAYKEDNIYYLTDEQFGFVAGVTGMMVRRKPAACFYMGAFFAESLILAETGQSIGSIQVAGTAMPAQLPFFVAACDYTLIGEEFFAASAYLSGEPHQLGSLKGQDVGKVFGVALLLLGCLAATLHAINTQWTWAASVASFISDNVLGDKGFLP